MSLQLNKPSTILLAGAAISSIGDWLNILALMAIFSESYGATMVAGLMTIRALPGVVVGPWVAGRIDRFNKRRLLLVLSVAQGVLALSLSCSSDPYLLLGLACLLSTLNTFTIPLIKALIPELCDRSELGRVNAAFGIVQSTCYVAMPLLSGLMVTAFGAASSFRIDALTFAVFAGMISLLKGGVRPEPAEPLKTQGGSGTREAWLWLRENPELFRAVLALGGTGFSLGMIYAVEISFFDSILHVEASRYGAFVALAGTGVLLGSFVCGRILERFSSDRLFGVGLALFAMSTCLFSLNRSLGLAVPLMLVSGLGEGLFNVSGTTLIQLKSKADRVGGNFTLLAVLSKTTMLLAMLCALVFLPSLGPEGLILLAGAFSLGVAVLWYGSKVELVGSQSVGTQRN